MVGKPMQADGPLGATYEDEPPVTLGELIATSDDNFDVLHALAMARAWPENVAWRDLDPWQRIGPDVLWMVHRQDFSKVERIARETRAHVMGLRWVARKGFARQQIERAVTDAIEKLVTGDCMPADIAALAAAMRKETYLHLRSEAMAFMVNCMIVAEYGFQMALGRRELN